MDNEEYRKKLNEDIRSRLEQLAILQYRGEIKGALIIVVTNDNMFRMMEAFGSDTLLQVNTGLDMAKKRVIDMILNHTKTAEDKD